MRRKLFLLLMPLVTLWSCHKKLNCSVPVFQIPAGVKLSTVIMSGIDSIFIRELDKSSGGFVYKDTITASELHLVDEILTLAGGEDRLAWLWAGRTYQIIIPGRQQSLLITDISFEGDTTVYFVADDDCQVSSSRFMNEPKSFQVNGVRQESRIIRLSY